MWVPYAELGRDLRRATRSGLGTHRIDLRAHDDGGPQARIFLAECRPSNAATPPTRSVTPVGRYRSR
jgi:hypothetical protein